MTHQDNQGPVSQRKASRETNSSPAAMGGGSLSSVGSAENQSIQRLQDAANQSPQVTQLKALQRSAAAGPLGSAPIQAVLDPELLKGLPEDVLTAVKHLDQFNDLAGTLSGDMLAMMGASVRGFLVTVKGSAFAGRFEDVISMAEGYLPPEIEQVDIPKVSHSMWVEGDYGENEEVQKGMASRKGGAIGGWQQIMWVYRREAAEDSGLKEIPVKVGGVDMVQKDFRAYLTQPAVLEAHPWLGEFVPILDILLDKKGYVAMGDLMRMIVLYLDGGLYTDVKITVKNPDADFFRAPTADKGGLHMAPGGENWALVAEAGSEMIETMLKEALKRLPSLDKLEEMPVNYANEGKYSQAHMELHENRSVFTSIDSRRGGTDLASIDSDLGLENPRAVNSWAHTDGVPFDWTEKKGAVKEDHLEA